MQASPSFHQNISWLPCISTSLISSHHLDDKDNTVFRSKKILRCFSVFPEVLHEGIDSQKWRQDSWKEMLRPLCEFILKGQIVKKYNMKHFLKWQLINFVPYLNSGDYIGQKLRENSFDPKGKGTNTMLDDLVNTLDILFLPETQLVIVALC